MAEQKQGGLGKGLAALIPSGPDAPTRKPRLGDSAADIILGNSTPQPGRKGGEGKQCRKQREQTFHGVPLECP